jgi:hypothetical protein
MEARLGRQAIELKTGATVYDTLDRKTGEVRRFDWNKKRRLSKTGTHDDYTWLLKPAEKKNVRRGKIGKLSGRSRRRCMFALADMQPAHLLTLTFQRVTDSRTCYRNLNTFLTWLRSIGIQRYVWVAELQERGALHFHLLFEDEKPIQKLWQWKSFSDESGRVIRRPNVAFAWNRIIGGNWEHLQAGVRIERVKTIKGGRSYICKYLSKGGADNFEGRRWGSNYESHLRIHDKSVVKRIYRILNRPSKWTIIGRSEESFARIKSIIEQAGDWHERHQLDARNRGTGHRPHHRAHDGPDNPHLEVGVQ